MIQTSTGERLVLVVSDLLLLAGAFLLAYTLRFHLGVLEVTSVPPPSSLEYGRAYLVGALLFLLVFRSRQLYSDLLARGIDVAERVVGAATLASALLLAATFFDRTFSYSRTVFLFIWALTSATMAIPRWAVIKRRRASYENGVGLIPALIVGTSERALDLHLRLSSHRRYGLDVLGLVSAGEEREPPAGMKVWGSLNDLERLLEESGARELLLAHDLERLRLFEVLELCERRDVEVRLVPQTVDLFVTPADLTELFGVPFVAVREDRVDRLSLALKRVFDLTLASTLLLLCLPLLACLALLVRRDGGPAFFSQRRVGYGGEVFRLWKLRSMVHDAEERLKEVVDLEALEEPVYKVQDDPRVTRIGRVLRRWSLDELPQLFNVILGDMSLVGPRPEVESVVARYNSHQRRRLKARPGLTGLQQVLARGSLDLEERIRLDVYYTRRRSFLFDLWILARTPLAVLLGKGAH